MRCALLVSLFVWPAAFCQSQPGWNLIWSDEFNGAQGTQPDPARWTYDLGATGWGNHELENYTNLAENASMDGQGHLVIKAIQTGARAYTSARLLSKGRFEVQYGRVEGRIQIPFGQGIWPAFWMLGNDIDKIGWPQSGEVDIMENIGKEPGTVHGTVHGPGYSGGNGKGAPFTLRPGRFADDFHVYAVEWTPASMEFFVDNERYFVLVPGNLPADAKWVFDHPFFLLLNLAVGGDWPGNPDATTTFPQQMLVDWVRVYQGMPDTRRRRP